MSGTGNVPERRTAFRAAGIAAEMNHGWPATHMRRGAADPRYLISNSGFGACRDQSGSWLSRRRPAPEAASGWTVAASYRKCGMISPVNTFM
jgi:hypothetical protein